MRASDAVPLDHPRGGDPEFCCAGGKHNYHFRAGASQAVGALIWCCCKSVLTEIEPENDTVTEVPTWNKSYGQIAYEAYVEHCGGRSINGDRLPAWDGQDAAIQAHWSAAGLAVVRQYRLEEEEP